MSAVTVVGLGNMGQALARVFREAGLEVTVWNRTASRADELASRGARVATTLAEAIQASPLVVLVLADYPATRSLLAAPDVAERLRGRTVLQLASGTAAEAVTFADWVSAQGGQYLDGAIRCYPREVGTEEAELGVCGPREAFTRHADVLGLLARTRYDGEEIGPGIAMSSAQAALMECVVVGFHEVLAFAIDAGVSPQRMLDGLPHTLRIAQRAIADSIEHLRREPSGRVVAEQAALSIHADGLATLVSYMDALGCRTDLTAAAAASLRAAKERGLGDFEISALMALHGRGGSA